LPIPLYDDTGIKIRRNDHNKFCVVELHYTADPHKRNDAWKAEAKAGMRQADWDREYEMSFTAVSGDLVFPEFVKIKHKIVVPQPYPEFGEHLVYYGGLDYGSRNPSSVHFYTIFDGVIYCVWELYEPCKDIVEFVNKIKAFPYYNRVKYIAADPTIFNKTTRNSQGMPASMYELFCQQGLTRLIRGNNDEQMWVANMRVHWTNAEDPTFRIFDCCPNIIREYESSVYTSMSDKAKMHANWKEKVLDKDNHAMDDSKYFLNSRPKERKKATSGLKSRWPELYKWYT